ncbi:MAG: SseB family protein [Austwickia sp.]|nr:SseB family protein [Austwickia sp.]
MSGFGADTGQADPAVVAALEAVADANGHERAEMALAELLSTARFLLPVVAAPPAVAQAWAHEGHAHGDHDHEHEDHEHPPGDTHDDADHTGASAMAAVRLVAPDGRQGLPVFTSLEALTSWDPSARPLPMAAPDVARMALEEGCDVLLVDLTAAHGYVVRSSQVWALAEERPWLPAHRDALVGAAVQAAGVGVDRVVGAVAQPAAAEEPGTLVVELTLEAGLTAEEIQAVVAEVGERLAGDPLVRCRLDAVRFALRPAAQA